MKTPHSKLVYLLAALITVCSFALVFYPDTYAFFTEEDAAVEYAGFALDLATGILLLYSFFKFRKTAPVYLLIGGAAIFLFAAGEEISWAQRIVGFGTPEHLSEINGQHEFNLHNIDKKFADRLVDRGIIFFALLSVLFLISGVKSLFSIPMPDGKIASGFAFIPFYHQYSQLHLDFYHVSYLSFLLLFIFAIKKGDIELVFTVMIYVILSAGIMLIHRRYQSNFSPFGNCANEIRECIFGIVALYYSIYIKNQLSKSILR